MATRAEHDDTRHDDDTGSEVRDERIRENDREYRGDAYPDDSRGVERERVPVTDAKTSAAAVFGLIFGLSALICVLSVILAPLALVLGIIGIVVAFFGRKMAGRPGVTGKTTATTGLVMSVIAVLLSLALAAGATFFLNDQGAVERLEDQIAQLRAELPDEIPTP